MVVILFIAETINKTISRRRQIKKDRDINIKWYIQKKKKNGNKR